MAFSALLLVFAGLALAGYGLAASRREATAEVESRLQRFGSIEQPAAEGATWSADTPNVVAQAVDRAVAGKGVSEQAATLLARANVRLTVGEYLLLRAGVGAGGFVVGLLAGMVLVGGVLALCLALLGAGAGWMGPQIYLNRRAKARTKRFEEQLGDAISLMANSLRAGYSLFQTMDLVARETPAPMGEEFLRVVREVGLGVSPGEALQHLLRRITSEDLDLMVTAISIQHEVGGNLAQILDVIGETIRERVRIKGEIMVLTAQGRLSGYIITGLPIALAGIMMVINPTYERAVLVYPWIFLPITAVILIVIGFVVMRKIVSIDV